MTNTCATPAELTPAAILLVFKAALADHEHSLDCCHHCHPDHDHDFDWESGRQILDHEPDHVLGPESIKLIGTEAQGGLCDETTHEVTVCYTVGTGHEQWATYGVNPETSFVALWMD